MAARLQPVVDCEQMEVKPVRAAASMRGIAEETRRVRGKRPGKGCLINDLACINNEDVQSGIIGRLDEHSGFKPNTRNAADLDRLAGGTGYCPGGRGRVFEQF
jgi:hypothetical protein